MSCHVMSCHVMSCHVMSCHVMSCLVMSCHVMSCHVMSCRVMSCRVMSCHVVSCHVMHIWLRISQKRWQTWQILTLSTNRKLHMSFRLAYLHLTLVHCKGQGQVHFDCQLFTVNRLKLPNIQIGCWNGVTENMMAFLYHNAKNLMRRT